jgi:AraC family transcriptional regulator of adaptative response / DNA-3-methyladenine glycosylase II
MVLRALDLIVGGELESGTVESLAGRLGITARHLRRLFDQHLGASPIAVAQAHRVLFAKQLITETSMSMTEVAFASGFGSIRRFNHVMQRVYGRPPRELRRLTALGRQAGDMGITLRLALRPPFNWPAMLSFLGPRAIPGVELVDGGCYRRTIAVDGVRGVAEVRPGPDEDCLHVTIRVSRVGPLASVVGRLRRLFDLDADVVSIESHLSRDPRLAPRVREHPGLRPPGAWDGFELAVRAILGQQVSVTAATTLVGRVVAAYGDRFAEADESGGDARLQFLFPRPEALAAADLSHIGIPYARAQAISKLAQAVVEDEDLLEPAGDAGSLEQKIARLRALPGIGDWTAQYIAMRALGEPDAFPWTDLGLARAMSEGGGRPTPAQLLKAAENWRPWRAYAAMHLWMTGTVNAGERRQTDGSPD